MFLLSLVPVSAQTIPPDTFITDALHLQMTPAGLDKAAEIALEVVPDDPFAIPDQSAGTLGAGFPGCLNDYGYDVTNGYVIAAVESAEVTAVTGSLRLEAEIEVTVNTPNDPIIAVLGAACVDGDCDAWVDPFMVSVSAPITLSVAGGDVAASIGTLTVDDNLSGANVHVTNCTAGTIIDLISSVYDPYDLLVDYARDEALALIPDFVDGFEVTINEALEVARFDDTIELLGSDLEIEFTPQDVTITPAGVDVQIGGKVFTELHECVAFYDDGSRSSSGSSPSVTALPSGTHVGARVSHDIVDQGLYTLWRTGLLCQNFEGGELQGFSLDSNLLTLIGGEAYEELFPETKPLTVRTAPENPPEVVESVDHDLGVQIEQLGIDFYAELDGRQAHVLGLNLSPEVGLDVEFSNTFGTLQVDLALPDDYAAELRGDPIVAGTDEVVEDVEGLISTVAEAAITGALGDNLSFELPTYDSPNGPNFGLRDLEVTGSGNGWTTGEAAVGGVTYNAAQGCDQGCQGSVGCSTPGGTASWILGLAVLIGLRRRQE